MTPAPNTKAESLKLTTLHRQASLSRTFLNASSEGQLFPRLCYQPAKTSLVAIAASKVRRLHLPKDSIAMGQFQGSVLVRDIRQALDEQSNLGYHSIGKVDGDDTTTVAISNSISYHLRIPT